MSSISDIRREKNNIYFTFHTNANMRSLCRLMTPNGVSVRTILFNAERKQYGQFSNVSPKKEYRLQCDIGNVEERRRVRGQHYAGGDSA